MYLLIITFNIAIHKKIMPTEVPFTPISEKVIHLIYYLYNTLIKDKVVNSI